MKRNLIFCAVGPGPGTVPFRKEPGATWDLVEVLWHPKMIQDHKEGRYKTDANIVLYELDRTKRKFVCFADAWASGAVRPRTEDPCSSVAIRRDYDAVLIADDDLTPVGCTWSDIFALFHKTGLNVAQPALAPGSTRIPSASVTHQKKSCEWRSTDFVEVMAPIFAGACIERLVPFFRDELYGLGLEMLWRERFAPIGVLDATPMLHTRPVGSAHSMSGTASHPWMQAAAFRERHGLTNEHHYPVRTLERHPPVSEPRVLSGSLPVFVPGEPGEKRSRRRLIIRQLAPDREPWPVVADRRWDLVELYFDPAQAVRAAEASAADVVVLDTERSRRKLATVKLLYRDHPEWFANRDAIAIIDDDVPSVGCSWDQIFDLFLETGTAIGQPALHASSVAVSHHVTRQVQQLRWRWTDFAEVMCPLFTSRALAQVVHLFDATESGWSVDDAWMHILREAVVLDATPVRHDRALGTSYGLKEAAREAQEWLAQTATPQAARVTLRHGPRALEMPAATCWSCLAARAEICLGSVLVCRPCLASGCASAMGVRIAPLPMTPAAK